MSTRYQSSRDVPTEVLAARLNELAHVVAQKRDRIGDEFTMRIPAECDRDADLVMSEAARRLSASPAVQEEPIPAGFALIKLDSRTGKPLVTSEMKAKHIGEYWWDEEAPYYDEHGDLHDYVARHAVPWSLCKEIYKNMASTAMLSAQPAEHKPSADDSLTPVPDELFAAEFASWWDEHGQFCRAGGGAYERSFAFEAWRYLYPQLMNLQMAAAEHQPAPDVAGLVDALTAMLEIHGVTQDYAEKHIEIPQSWVDVSDIARAALAAYRKGGGA